MKRNESCDSWEEADYLLRVKCEAQLDLEGVNAWLTDAVNDAKAKAAKTAEPLHERIAGIDAALKAFWKQHAEEVKPAKSRPLNFGTIGSRASKAVKFLKGWKVAKILDLLPARFVRTKKYIDRNVILAKPPEDLLEYGLFIEEKETFFAEPDRAAVEKVMAK